MHIRVIFLLALAASTPIIPAGAQEPEVCRRAALENTPEALERLKLCQEVSKLRQEVSALEAANRAPLGAWLPYSGMITGVLGGVFTFVVALLGFLFRGTLQATESRRMLAEAEKLGQERRIQRENQNVRLMEAIGSPNRSLQLAAASALLRRIEELKAGGQAAAGDPELRMLLDVVVAVLRNPELDDYVSKYVADQMVRVFRLKPKKGALDTTKRPMFKLADFDLSHAKLRGVDWQRVDIGACELFRADFEGATLRDANLKGSVCYETSFANCVLAGANLEDAELTGADLRGANLRGTILSGAKNLDRARFDSRTRYDEATRWPAGFSPAIVAGAP